MKYIEKAFLVINEMKQKHLKFILSTSADVFTSFQFSFPNCPGIMIYEIISN